MSPMSPVQEARDDTRREGDGDGERADQENTLVDRRRPLWRFYGREGGGERRGDGQTLRRGGFPRTRREGRAWHAGELEPRRRDVQAARANEVRLSDSSPKVVSL